jgi:hypothetical protein
VARSASKSNHCGLKAARANCSSLSAKQASVKPKRAASSLKICVFGLLSPSGAMAGSLIKA